MKKLFKLSLVTLSLATLASTTALAEDSPHVIGIQLDIGSIDNKETENTRELNDITTSHYTLSYQYSINDYIAVGAGYLNGDSDSVDGFLIDIFTDSHIDYNAFMISARAQYPISLRNSFYVQVNALQYDYDIIDDSETVYSSDGSDFGLSAGWKYQYDMGIGLKVGYDILNLGDDIQIDGVNVEVSYRF